MKDINNSISSKNDILEDKQLIKEILAGDTDLFSELINRYIKNVEKIVISHIGSDNLDEVANDIFFKVFKSLASYKFDAPFSHWLSVISVRSCKDFWRAHYSRKEQSFADFEDMATLLISDQLSIGKSPENILIEQEDAVIIKKSLEILKPDERNIINMMYNEELSIKEIAVELNLSESNVKIIAFRARKKLAIKLEKLFNK